jgi:hypothetical protein
MSLGYVYIEYMSNAASEWLIRMIHIRQVRGSDLDPEKNYPVLHLFFY